jgi:rhodanese-related sulfurtransferase
MLSSAIQTQTQAQISENMFPSEAHAFISKNKDSRDLIILDVCTPKEFSELHLENAVNLNFFLRGFKDQLKALDKNKTYLVYCKVGGRSKLAQKSMKKLDFREVYNIVGGTLLWAEEELPFAPGSERPRKFSLCPIFISITLVRKLRKFFQSGYRSLGNAISAAGLLRKNLRYRLGV